MLFKNYKQSIEEDELQYICGGEDIHMVLFSDFKRAFKVMGFGNNKENSIHDFWNNLENYTYEMYLLDCLRLVTGNSKECCERRIKKDKNKCIIKIKKRIKILT